MSKPLSYDGSKCVLQYLDANSRFIFTQRCPSLSTMNRIVPLHIQSLEIDSTSNKINGTEYTTKPACSYKIEQAWLTAARNPSKHYTEMIIKSNESERREWLVHDKNTAIDAKDYLLRKLFRNKKSVVVTKLTVKTGWWFVFSLLPLAPGTLRVQSLKVTANLQVVINCLQPIWNNKPLKSLEANHSGMPPNSDENPVVTSSGQLILSDTTDINFLTELRVNKNIHLRKCVSGKQQIENLVHTWENSVIEVGKCYSIGFEDEIRVRNFLEIFKKLPSAERRRLEELRNTTFPDCVIIPIRNDAELNVYCEKTSVEDQKFCEQPYIGKIKTQPSGYEVNLNL